MSRAPHCWIYPLERSIRLLGRRTSYASSVIAWAYHFDCRGDVGRKPSFSRSIWTRTVKAISRNDYPTSLLTYILALSILKALIARFSGSFQYRPIKSRIKCNTLQLLDLFVMPRRGDMQYEIYKRFLFSWKKILLALVLSFDRVSTRSSSNRETRGGIYFK